MQTATRAIVLKSAALFFAMTLSAIYIVYQWPDSKPVSTDPEQSAAQDPLATDTPDAADPPGEPEIPKFDLNEALSKTGTIKFNKDTSGGEGGLFGDDADQAKE